jgi:haloacetate dehalogenase
LCRGQSGTISKPYPLTIWRTWADDVRSHGIDSGHHMAGEAPEALAASLGDFFSPQ